MRTAKNVLVITTRENSRWWSMQEIIPAIERVWVKAGVAGRTNVRFFNVSAETESAWADLDKNVDIVVVTASTPGAIRRALELRQREKSRAPIFIYVHGDATAGFTAFGKLVPALRQDDAFIVSCEADARAVRLSFVKPQVFTVPFPLVDGFHLNEELPAPPQKHLPLAYVGRVSEQKNLHGLLFALWILRRFYPALPKTTLDVYGRQDNYGSPNMGLNFPAYGTYLKGLAAELELDHIVKWHGFKTRDWIFDHVHTQPHVFVSPTMHSDENFGASGLASMVNGAQAVMTAWGGHVDFQKWFPEQLTLVPVHGSARGPCVSPFALADAVYRAAHRFRAGPAKKGRIERARLEFSEEKSVARTLNMLKRRGGSPKPLLATGLLTHIAKRRKSFGEGRRLYAGYHDLASMPFFAAYGMLGGLTESEGTYLLPPWASCVGNELRVDDPHRGPVSFHFDDQDPNCVEVRTCPDLKTLRLPEAVVARLANEGSAFLLPPHTLALRMKEEVHHEVHATL